MQVAQCAAICIIMVICPPAEATVTFIRRHRLAIVCCLMGGALFASCAVMVVNFLALSDAEILIGGFVQHAIADGSAMTLPDLPPQTAAERAMLIETLDRARRIGPLITIEPADCVAQSDAANLCGGQLLACVVRGTGDGGSFESYVAMCRSGNFSPYRFARSAWSFHFTHREPESPEARSPI